MISDLNYFSACFQSPDIIDITKVYCPYLSLLYWIVCTFFWFLDNWCKSVWLYFFSYYTIWLLIFSRSFFVFINAFIIRLRYSIGYFYFLFELLIQSVWYLVFFTLVSFIFIELIFFINSIFVKLDECIWLFHLFAGSKLIHFVVEVEETWSLRVFVFIEFASYSKFVHKDLFPFLFRPVLTHYLFVYYYRIYLRLWLAVSSLTYYNVGRKHNINKYNKSWFFYFDNQFFYHLLGISSITATNSIMAIS